MFRKILSILAFLALGVNCAHAYNPIKDPLNTERLVNKKLIACDADIGSIKELDLDNIINLALCNNPQTKQAMSALLSNQAKVGAAYKDYLPSITANSSYSSFYNAIKMPSLGNVSSAGTGFGGLSVINGTGQYSSNSLALNYLLYDFGQRSANLETVKQALFAANYNRDDQISLAIFSAIKKYYNYLSLKEVLRAEQENYDLAQTNFNYANKRKTAGLAKKLDVLQAKSNLSAARVNLLQVKQDLETAHIDLTLFIGLNPSTKITIKTQGLEQSKKQFAQSSENIDELVNIAAAQNPQLKKAEAEYKLSQANLDKIKSSGYPKLMASASADRDYAISGTAFDRNYRAVGLTLTIPIFSGFADFYNNTQARYDMEESAAKLEQTKRDIILQTWQAYNRFQIAKENLSLTKDLLEAAVESEEQARQGYQFGTNDLRDVLNTEAELFDAKEKSISARYQFYISKIDLLKVIGGL